MADWKVVAEGTNIWDLESTVGELDMPKGSELMVVMDLKLPLGWIFDTAGAELIFKPFIPEGIDLVDVYGEGSQAIVTMEVDPPYWFMALLGFVKANWIAIVISGFVLATIIASIIILAKIAVAPALPIAAMAIGGGLALIGILAIVASKRREVITQKT